MTFYGLITLRPKDREERKKVKNTIETEYQGKVIPVPRSLRKEAAEECPSCFKSSLSRPNLVWLVEFPSYKEYEGLLIKYESPINGIHPISEEPPEFLSKMRS
jgi:hypothetical protein